MSAYPHRFHHGGGKVYLTTSMINTFGYARRHADKYHDTPCLLMVDTTKLDEGTCIAEDMAMGTFTVDYVNASSCLAEMIDPTDWAGLARCVKSLKRLATREKRLMKLAKKECEHEMIRWLSSYHARTQILSQ